MAISKRVGGALVTAVAAAAVIGLSATPAMASTTLKAVVKGGGSITATTGSKGDTTLSVDGLSVTCTPVTSKGKLTPASEASGSISNGTHKGAEPLAVGSTSKLSFNHCSGLLGVVTNKVDAVKNGYKISVDSKTSKAGDTAGVIGPVKVSVSMTGCSFVVTGYAPGYYNNKLHELVVTSKLPSGLKGLFKAQLTISDVPKVTGECDDVIKDGQHPTYASTYTISRKVTISST